MRKISISEPRLNRADMAAVLKVLKSGQLAQGKMVAEFENEFAAYIGTKYAVATSNGTTALHLALLALDLQPGEEVITTPFSFIASTSAILYVGAKPVFVDIGEDYNLDVSKIERVITPKTKAILVVHLYGNPADMIAITKISKKYHLKVIEDAAQAHGASINGKKVGSLGVVGCFSFYPTKNMTTIEGGMVTTNNAKIVQKVRLLRNHGSVKRYYHQLLGFNFRLNDVQAALGLSQLKQLEKHNQLRIRNAQLYRKYLTGVKEISLPAEARGSESVYHQFTIRTKQRAKLLDQLQAAGIETAIYYPVPIHKQEVIKKLGYKVSLPIAEKFSAQVVSLPVHPNISSKQIKFIAQKIKEIVST